VGTEEAGRFSGTPDSTMTGMELTPQGDSWRLPVAEQQITRFCVDNEAVRVLCRNMIEISISEPFTLVTNDGRRYTLDPGGDAMDLAPALQIVRLVIREGAAFNDGRLELDLSDGSRIKVPPSRDFEAWTLTGPGGPDGLKVVSIPGGDLAIWSDRKRQG
jgi:hypothetical protein